jgi:hypothetical protein
MDFVALKQHIIFFFSCPIFVALILCFQVGVVFLEIMNEKYRAILSKNPNNTQLINKDQEDEAVSF